MWQDSSEDVHRAGPASFLSTSLGVCFRACTCMQICRQTWLKSGLTIRKRLHERFLTPRDRFSPVLGAYRFPGLLHSQHPVQGPQHDIIAQQR
jgi:hypothetical protein